ncbi:hypothetical protein ACHAXR_001886, partial [Thalassiosira sp. AJA248-18]
VVFDNGEKALQVLSDGLVDRIPEAKLNLAIYYLKHGEIEAAAELIGDMDMEADSSPQSHLVLGILNAELAQVYGDASALTKAKHHFQSMGQSPTDCDTIPGRQSLASYFILMNQFDDANFYLDSIKAYLEDNGDLNSCCFNWNSGMSLAASGKFAEGLEALLKVSNKSYKTELAFILWLVKCYIMTNHPEDAWECYLQTEDSNVTYEILQLIGNECYRIGGDKYFYASRSFNELLKMDSYPDYLDGLIGACVGYFRHVVSAKWQGEGSKLNKIDSDNLTEVVGLLESSSSPKGQRIAQNIKMWAIQSQVLDSIDKK